MSKWIPLFFLLSAPAFAHDLELHEQSTKIGNQAKTVYSLTGKVVYTFEKDKKSVSSVCVGSCAEVWPPVLLSKKEVLELRSKTGMIEVKAKNGQEYEKSGFGIIVRGEAGKTLYQLTFNGWPLYFFAFDRSGDDAYGDEHNPGGVEGWYALTSDFQDHD